MKNNLTICVGISTYNREKIIGKCLDGIAKQSIKPNEIIIVDSSTNNKTRKEVNKFKILNIKYLKFTKRVILPKGRNIILHSCKSEIITFIDDDAIPETNWIKNILKSFIEHNVSGVTGPTINVNKKFEPFEKIIYDKKNRDYFTIWGEIRNDARRWIPPKSVYCTTMSGGNMSYYTNELKEISGFDEKFSNPSFREETDVQMRLINKNKRFIYNPKVFVYHFPGVEGGIQDIEKKFADYNAICGKNQRYFSDKYFNKFLARLSWIFWSKNPPCLWIAFIRTVIERKNYLAWHKGLWSRD